MDPKLIGFPQSYWETLLRKVKNFLWALWHPCSFFSIHFFSYTGPQTSPMTRTKIHFLCWPQQKYTGANDKIHTIISTETLVIVSTRTGLHTLWITVGDLLTTRPKASLMSPPVKTVILSTWAYILVMSLNVCWGWCRSGNLLQFRGLEATKCRWWKERASHLSDTSELRD